MVTKILSNGKFWMTAWIVVIFVMIVWSILTVVFWMDSVRNVNALSLVANLGMGFAGLQSTLAMRKADSRDRF